MKKIKQSPSSRNRIKTSDFQVKKIILAPCISWPHTELVFYQQMKTEKSFKRESICTHQLNYNILQAYVLNYL